MLLLPVFKPFGKDFQVDPTPLTPLTCLKLMYPFQRRTQKEREACGFQFICPKYVPIKVFFPMDFGIKNKGPL